MPVFAESPVTGPVMAPVGLSQPSLNPFSRSLVDVPGAGGSLNPAAAGASYDTQALRIVEHLVASRQVSSQLRQTNAPTSDLNDVQTLISLLQQQQTLAGISSNNTNPEIELSFLTAMFQALSRVVAAVVRQQGERERLTKLINWMYVQMVRNRQSLFSTPDSLSLFSANRPEMPQEVLVQPFDETMAAAHRQQQQQSLSRIPELAVASSAILPAIPARMPTSPEATIPLGSPMTFVPGLDTGFPHQQRTSAQWLRGSSLDSRPALSSFFGFGSHAGALRQSDESSGTRLSSGARNSNSLSINRSSAETDNFSRRHEGLTSQDSQRMSYDDANYAPDFVFHEWSTAASNTAHRVPPPPLQPKTTNAPPPPPPHP